MSANTKRSKRLRGDAKEEPSAPIDTSMLSAAGIRSALLAEVTDAAGLPTVLSDIVVDFAWVSPDAWVTLAAPSDQQLDKLASAMRVFSAKVSARGCLNAAKRSLPAFVHPLIDCIEVFDHYVSTNVCGCDMLVHPWPGAKKKGLKPVRVYVRSHPGLVDDVNGVSDILFMDAFVEGSFEEEPKTYYLLGPSDYHDMDDYEGLDTHEPKIEDPKSEAGEACNAVKALLGLPKHWSNANWMAVIAATIGAHKFHELKGYKEVPGEKTSAAVEKAVPMSAEF